jgi:hypothetical protein
MGGKKSIFCERLKFPDWWMEGSMWLRTIIGDAVVGFVPVFIFSIYFFFDFNRFCLCMFDTDVLELSLIKYTRNTEQ